jgi:hypothetical protein
MAVDNHEYYQTEGNRLGPEAASGPPGSRTRRESRSRTTCRLGRDPSTFIKKIIFRLLKFSYGIRPSTKYSRQLRPVLKHGTSKRARKVATLWWYITKGV